MALFNAIKYCYCISGDDFYNINVKDIFKVGLSNVTDYDAFKHLGISLDKAKLGEMGLESFNEVLSIIRYSFAIRLPFMRKIATESQIKDNQLNRIYSILEDYGFANPDGIVEESLKSMTWLVKTKKKKAKLSP